jgi:hypothetical protein
MLQQLTRIEYGKATTTSLKVTFVGGNNMACTNPSLQQMHNFAKSGSQNSS